MRYKSRDELKGWAHALLFAYAVSHGFINQRRSGFKHRQELVFSYRYGLGHNDTAVWTVPYNLDEAGLPMFEAEHLETVWMVLAGEHRAATPHRLSPIVLDPDLPKPSESALAEPRLNTLVPALTEVFTQA